MMRITKDLFPPLPKGRTPSPLLRALAGIFFVGYLVGKLVRGASESSGRYGVI